MDKVLKLEELAMFLASILMFNQLDFSWWYYPVFILFPDFSMLGYLINTKAGALVYNFFHHKALAIAVLIIGYYTANQWVMFSGIILFGHSSMDRVFGYGLKYPDSFQHTHLGMIGKNQTK